MVRVTSGDRMVFPAASRTKADLVAYYERIAPRLLPHVQDRPLSIRRFPKGVLGAGFFQKNVPDHYPPSIARLEVPRSHEATKRHAGKGTRKGSAVDDAADMTVYPLVSESEDLAFLANQNAIELHVPTSRVPRLGYPDRLVLDLDPPSGALDLVRRAAHLARARLETLGLSTVPLATGSKGYHLVAVIEPTVTTDVLGETLQKLAALLAAEHPHELTDAFRIAERGGRVFVDWLRNRAMATSVVPYSLRGRSHAPVAAPIAWDELDNLAPDAFTIGDLEVLLERPDPIREATAQDAAGFVTAVDTAFAALGLPLTPFDRFRS